MQVKGESKIGQEEPSDCEENSPSPVESSRAKTAYSRSPVLVKMARSFTTALLSKLLGTAPRMTTQLPPPYSIIDQCQ